MIQPWQATCMQVYCNLVNSARNRDEAMTIINRSLDRWVTLIRGTARGGGRQLLLFPEFCLTGFPLTETAKEWIDKACIEIPGPITERLQRGLEGGRCAHFTGHGFQQPLVAAAENTGEEIQH